ncbi:molybdopterin synthase subunit MoaD2 [Saccharopolyspora gloriosae]|uniref:Molybdopterin synthase sulfur carrier subunit n=1 Tax=Saccharopolyspora gloriosae TaxID=455344 RepID=A0A840NSK8_9PSEU|nr:MoaD/ThiS family protein [Saccharopolyspora gloriosae]MBB5072142.1 molybdopterin converting factor small subunit [Saccharopolyspora gloriosae]
MTVQFDDTPTALAVRVRYFAGARAAAGVAEETLRVSAGSPGPVRASDVIDAVLGAHDERLASVVPACSFLLNGVAVRDRSTSVDDGDELDVLPPFAGG